MGGGVKFEPGSDGILSYISKSWNMSVIELHSKATQLRKPEMTVQLMIPKKVSLIAVLNFDLQLKAS